MDFFAAIDGIEQFCATPEQLAEHEKQAREERVKSALSTSGIPLPPHDRKSVMKGTLGSTAALSTIKRWVLASNKRVLVLCGPLGIGKTVAAAWLLGEYPGYYTTLEDLCRLQDARFGEDAQLWKRYRGCGTLVVDELGAESHPAAKKTFHELVDWRSSKDQRTLFLSNLNATELKTAMRSNYDPRTIDRLNERGAMHELRGESMRKKAGGW